MTTRQIIYEYTAHEDVSQAFAATARAVQALGAVSAQTFDAIAAQIRQATADQDRWQASIRATAAQYAQLRQSLAGGLPAAPAAPAGANIAGAGGGALSPSYIAGVQTQFVRLSAQIETMQRGLQGLAQTHPDIRVQSNFPQLDTELRTLAAQLQQVGERPITVTARDELAPLRTGVAEAQRSVAGLRGDVALADQAVGSFGRTSERAAGQGRGFAATIVDIGKGLLIYRAFATGESVLTNTIKDSLQLAGSLEQVRQGFVAFLGSTQAANQELAQLQAFSIKAPLFDVQNTRQYALQLLGVGDAAQRIIPDLKTIGSIVVGQGGGQQQLQEAVLAYQQVVALGRLQGQEARQFSNALVPIWKIISEGLGVSIEQARALSEQGAITAAQFQQAFSDYAVTHFADSLDRAGNTLAGLGSQVRESWVAALTDFGTGLGQGVEPALRDIAAILQDPKTLATITAWGVAAGQFVAQLWGAVRPLAEWAGLTLPDLPAPPDYGPAVQQTADLANNLRNMAAQAQLNTERAAQYGRDAATIRDAQTAYDRQREQQITTIRDAQAAYDQEQQDSITRLRDTQTSYDRARERDTTRIRDAQAAQDRAYDSQLQKLRDQGTQIDRNYQMQRAQADLADAQTKLAEDTALAGNIFTSVGQAARERLKDDQRRVADQQAQIGHDTAKAANEDAVTRVERSKQAYDQIAQDGIAAAAALKQSFDQQQQDAIAGIQTQQQAYDRTAQTGIAAAEHLRQAYDQVAQDGIAAAQALQKALTDAAQQAAQQTQTTLTTGTQTTISAQTREYQTFYDYTLPNAAAAAQPQLYTALLGTPGQQSKIGQDAGTAIMEGLGLSLSDWSQGHSGILMDIIMGGNSPADAVKNWVGANAEVESWGSALAKGLFPNFPGIGPAVVAATGGNTPTTAPASAPNTILGGVPVPGFLSGVYGATQSTATQIRQRARPTGSPTGHGAGQWIAGKSYTDGTTDWTWVDAAPIGPPSPTSAATQEYAGFYGGNRQSGGPVYPGQSYTVGERGPEMLVMGARGGYVQPGPTGGGMVASAQIINYNITINGLGFVGNKSQLAQELGQIIATYGPGEVGGR